jgi:heat shock 70kDa protein 1/2/6/8
VIEVNAVSSIPNFGGQDFDDKMIEFCIADFKQKSGIDITGNSRALRRLRTQCEDAKKTLSTAL